MERLSNDTIAMVNENMIKAIAFSLSLLMVASVLCLFGSGSIHFKLSGFDVQVRRVDAFFITGLLIVCVNVYNFYKKIVCELGETPNHALFSFIGMLIMFALVLVMFFERVFSVRFLLVALYAVGVMWKNRQVAKELREVRDKIGRDIALAERFEVWYRRARYSAMFAAVGGIVFFAMFDERVNSRWLPLMVEGAPVGFSTAYYDWVPLVFYLFFTMFAVKLFREDAAYMSGEQFPVDLDEVKSANARPATVII